MKHQNIFYQVKGKGEPVLLLHGYCETHVIWNELAEELAKHYQVIEVDLPGFGDSQSAALPQSLEECAKQLHSLMKELNLHPALVVGHSLGGYITLELIRQFPESFRGFCLFHSTAFEDSEEKKNTRKQAIRFAKENGVDPLMPTMIPNLFSPDNRNTLRNTVNQLTEIAKQTPLETFVAYNRAMMNRRGLSQVYREFAGTKLLIAGKHDQSVSYEDSLKQSQNPIDFAVFEHSAHMGMFEEKQKAIETLLSFSKKTFG